MASVAVGEYSTPLRADTIYRHEYTQRYRVVEVPPRLPARRHGKRSSRQEFEGAADVSYLYELALLGSPSPDQIRALEGLLASSLEGFGLRLGDSVGWVVS